MKRWPVAALVAVLLACGGSIFDDRSDQLRTVAAAEGATACNGRTIGFWANRIGVLFIDAEDLAYLASFRLVDGSGMPVSLTTPAAVSTFLRRASATNMANMLSAQWVAFALNYRKDLFCQGLEISFYFPDFPEPGEGPDGTVTFDQIADAVAAALAEGSEATGEEMEFLKDFLDAANN
ncbi:MAG TPA: hypothetical protein VLS93_14305, partial [Anaeromyxobacteraceae bacterium]|nr:hypothetical protein [Anaeromyxobacteraceae bacterium]